jgi:hypothetical protein
MKDQPKPIKTLNLNKETVQRLRLKAGVNAGAPTSTTSTHSSSKFSECSRC